MSTPDKVEGRWIDSTFTRRRYLTTVGVLFTGCLHSEPETEGLPVNFHALVVREAPEAAEVTSSDDSQVAENDAAMRVLGLADEYVEETLERVDEAALESLNGADRVPDTEITVYHDGDVVMIPESRTEPDEEEVEPLFEELPLTDLDVPGGDLPMVEHEEYTYALRVVV